MKVGHKVYVKCNRKRNHNLKVEIVSLDGVTAEIKSIEGAMEADCGTLVSFAECDVKHLSSQPWPEVKQEKVENVIPLFGGY